MEAEDDAASRWSRLVAWLADQGMKIAPDRLLVQRRPTPGAGYGLYSTAVCPPSTPLFTIPASALLNVKTLSSLYPSRLSGPLSAIQMISLHLFLHRPQQDSRDPLFGPYISILPREFEAHPLTWLVKQKLLGHQAALEAMLLDFLPPSVAASLHALGTRFWADWDIVQEYLGEHPSLMAKSTRSELSLARVKSQDTAVILDFAWAWLNVNTRCIYHQLKMSRSDPDNLTLCPVLDFANHASNKPRMLPAVTSNVPGSKSKNGFTLLSPADITVNQGEELYLTYGAHANRTLFVEYGFVDGEHGGEVDVQDIVEGLFSARGAWMKELLEKEGYWGDWTIHTSPQPAHPSFRLITALRLYSLSPDATSVPSDHMIQPWRDTLLGTRAHVSEANEHAWRGVLADMCATVMQRAVAGAGRVAGCTASGEWPRWALGNIRMLWAEEETVAGSVADSVQGGAEF